MKTLAEYLKPIPHLIVLADVGADNESMRRSSQSTESYPQTPIAGASGDVSAFSFEGEKERGRIKEVSASANGLLSENTKSQPGFMLGKSLVLLLV